MAPNDEVSGLRTALAMGAAKADPRVRPCPPGLRRAVDGEGDRQGDRAGRRDGPRAHGHRVHRRLHRHRARAGRRAARLAVAHVRQAHRDRRRQGQDPAPDRSRLRHRRGVAPRGRQRDRRRRRAALPVVQGDHGGEEQAGRQGEGRRPRLVATTRSAGTGARQEIKSIEAAPERQAGEKIEDEGDAHERIVAFLEQLKVI